MSPDWIILLIAIPLTGGVVSLMLGGRDRTQHVVGITTLVASLIFAGWCLPLTLDGAGAILVSPLGSWPAPFGVSAVLDPLAALMCAVAALVMLCIYPYCLEQLPKHMTAGFFTPLYLLLQMGVQWSFLTGDLFNLFVAFEILLMASYVMLVNGTTRRQMRHAYKYILLNLLASMILVTCCGLIYAQTGTLNLADLARLSVNDQLPATFTPVAALLLLAFGMKTAIFPLWFWLPETYPTLHASIGALFGGLLTKVGAYVMLRIFTLTLGNPDAAVAQTLVPPLLVAAALTMFVGVLGAVSMHSIRAILSIHIISQVGYMLMGIALGMSAALTPAMRELAVAGAIFFVIHNMVVKSVLFLCGGLVRAYAGGDDLERIGGVLKATPWLGVLFLLAALSLAGLPPFSGFFGKFALIEASFRGGIWWLGAFAILTSLLTLMSMLKIWSYGFWSAPAGLHVELPRRRPRRHIGMISVATLVLTALSMGLLANWWFDASRKAARLVVEPRGYIDAVLIESTERLFDNYRLPPDSASRPPQAEFVAGGEP